MTGDEFSAELSQVVARNHELVECVHIAFENADGQSVVEAGRVLEGRPHTASKKVLFDGDHSALVRVWQARSELPSDFIAELSSLAREFWAPDLRNDRSGMLFRSKSAVAQRAARSFDRYLQRQGECGVVYFDLDNFKAVNAQLGQEKGHKVIGRIGAFLMPYAQKAIILQDGGDEFALIAPGTSPDECLDLAMDILERGREFDFQSESIPVGISLGVATTGTSNAIDLKNLIDSADAALKAEVKLKVKGTVRFGRTESPDRHPYLGFGAAVTKAAAATNRPVSMFSSPWLNVIAERVFRAWSSSTDADFKDRTAAAVNLALQVGALSPTANSGGAHDFPRSSGFHAAPEVAWVDVAMAVACGILKAVARGSCPTVQGPILLVCDGASVTVSDQGRALWEVGGIDGLAPAAIDLGFPWTIDPTADNVRSGLAIVVNIGHTVSPVPPEFTAHLITVDNRPTDGGGLPDFWELAIAELAGAVLSVPGDPVVIVTGAHGSGTHLIRTLKEAAEWDLDWLSAKTNLQRSTIEDIQKRIAHHVTITNEQPEILARLTAAYHSQRTLGAAAATGISLSPKLNRELDTSAITLSIADGCRFRTAAEAYPCVLEVLRKHKTSEELVNDQAGVGLTELVDFKVELLEPLRDAVPAFYEREKELLEKYYRTHFLEEGGLFHSGIHLHSQYTRVIEHVVGAITSKAGPYATRRAIIVIPHVPIPDQELRPLGLVSIRCLPRFLPGNKVRLSFSYTWRTVEALVGFPYSLFGSVRFSEGFVDSVRAALVGLGNGLVIEVGRISYIAHSLHMFRAPEALSIARRIVNDATA